MKNAKIIVLSNHKGGTAKTTTSLNIGHGLADRGFKVLLVDLDAQANLTDLCGYGGIAIKEEECISQALRNKKNKAFIKPVKDNLDLIPSQTDSMFGIEFELQSLLVGGDKQLERVLKPFYDVYDYIIIDLPPALNALTVNAYMIADRLMVPILSDYLSLTGFYKLEQKLEDAFDIHITDVVVTRHETSTSISRQVVEEMKKSRPHLLYDTVIRKNVAIIEQGSGEKKYSIYDYAPTSIGATDYNNMVDELLNRLNK